MKKAGIILIFLLAAVPVGAQQFEWLQTPNITFNSNPDNIGYPCTADNQGNTFVCGFKDNALHYTDTFGNLWLLKYDSAGQLLFSKTIDGSVCAYSMKTDSLGNLYVAAAYINEITVDDLHLTTTWQGVKPILLKFNSNGVLLWNKPITVEFAEHFKALAIDSSQNVYIGYDNFMDSYIEKIDTNGNSLLLITQTQVKSISCVSVDTEGNIYGTGSCAETNVNFNGTALVNTLPYNTYLVKYNPSGVLQWNHFQEDVTCPEPQVVARTPNEVYFSSYLFGSYNFGNITTEGPENGGFSDFFLARLNALGEYQWVKEVPGNGEVLLGNRNFLALDSEGNPYLAAKTRGNIQWSPSVSTQSVSFNYDILVLKYTPQGEVVWAKMAGGSEYDRTDGITILPDGNAILTGMASGNVTFDSFTHSASNFTYYPYIAKINTALLGIHTPALSLIATYPNPTTSSLTLNIPNYRGVAFIYSVLGQQVKSIPITTEATVIDVSGLAAGTYFIKAENHEVGKFIKL